MTKFRTGQSGNPAGRPKGSRNKNQLRNTVEGLISTHFDSAKVEADMKQLDAKDRLNFLLRLIEFSLPKLKAIELTDDLDRLDDSQLDEILEQIKKIHDEQDIYKTGKN